MTQQTQTILIIGGLAIVGFIAYKKFAGGTGRLPGSPVTTSTAGTGNSVPVATSSGTGGNASFWDTLGAAGKGLNAGTSSVESLYNNVYGLFGGDSATSTNTGQGNNGTQG